jgi:hypothetical protein
MIRSLDSISIPCNFLLRKFLKSPTCAVRYHVNLYHPTTANLVKALEAEERPFSLPERPDYYLLCLSTYYQIGTER